MGEAHVRNSWEELMEVAHVRNSWEELMRGAHIRSSCEVLIGMRGLSEKEYLLLKHSKILVDIALVNNIFV